jgi:hypothetical protein
MTRHHWQISSAAALLVIATAAAPVAAQSRLEISANAGVATGAKGFQESETYASNGGENATVTVDHAVKTAVGFNAGAAVRIVRQLWVGVQYAQADTKAGASVTAVVPHPILFNAPRTVQGSADNLAHNEQNLHLELMYALPVGGAAVKVMAGPTFFNVKQDFVSSVTVTESYPFDSAAFGSATTKQLSKSAVGFNVGADIAFPLSSRFAIGALARYSRADVSFEDKDIDRQTVKAGGLEIAGGIRLRF